MSLYGLELCTSERTSAALPSMIMMLLWKSRDLSSRVKARDPTFTLNVAARLGHGAHKSKKAKHMKSIIVLGILLVVLGGLALAYQGFNYTRREKVIDIGPIHATADTQEHVPLPPIVGGLALAAGVVLLAAGAKQKT
jgi:hypothetical protein